MATVPEIVVDTPDGCSRTFPLGTLPTFAIRARESSMNPHTAAFTAVGEYWRTETDFSQTIANWAASHNVPAPRKLCVYASTAMTLASRTDQELWLAQSNEANEKYLAGLAYSRDTPRLSDMPELARQGISRLLRQILTRAGSVGELPGIPVPTVDQIKPYYHKVSQPPLSRLFTLSQQGLLAWLTPVSDDDYEEELDEWITVNAVFDGCPSKSQVNRLLEAITDLNNQPELEDWWTTNSGYRLLSLIFHITTNSDSHIHARWCETYVPVGSWGEDHSFIYVYKPTPILELTVPSWDDYNVETWQQYLVDALREAARTLNLPAPPPVSWTTHAPTPAQRNNKPTSDRATSPHDPELLELAHDPSSSYTLRTNSDTTTVFTRINDTVFAVEIPTPIAAQHPGEAVGDYCSLCDTTSAFGDLDSEIIFQFVVVPEDEADAQGTGDGTVVADWWEDDGFYVEDTPETDEFVMRHVNDEDDDGNPTEVRALRRMVSADGYVFVTMWTYPYNTVASEQQTYDDSLTTMRIITT